MVNASSPVVDPTVFCCENFLPPKAGLYNFWATLTTIPMWLVPLTALREGFRTGASWSVLSWLVALTTLFLDGTYQHAVGPESAGPIDPIVLGNVQNALLAGCLAGAPGPLSAAFAAVPVLVALYWRSQQEIVGGAMQALLSPYIIGTMGYRSWSDAPCWRLFVRACAGFVAVHACIVVEPKLCGRPGAEVFHAFAQHFAIVMVFGNVAFLALRLLGQPERRKME